MNRLLKSRKILIIGCFLLAQNNAPAVVPTSQSVMFVGALNSAPYSSIFSLSPTDNALVRAPNISLTGTITNDIYTSSNIIATLNGSKLALDDRGNFSKTLSLVKGSNSLMLQATVPNPRQQTTQISTFIDAGMVYGTDPIRAKALRLFKMGALKTSGDRLMPLNTAGLDNANDAHVVASNELFLAGDIRANENLELMAIQTLFLREHNTLAAAIALANPKLNDEDIFQRARKIVIAEIQVITYEEFLPALMGANPLVNYPGYKSDVNPGLNNEFSGAAFRIGHTMINDDVQFLNNEGLEIRPGLSLANAFFNPVPLKELGPDSLLKYLASDNAQEIDTLVIDGLRDFLFGPPGSGGLDLVSLNIQRGRDHGLADYNSIRKAYGLPTITSVDLITSNNALRSNLVDLYGNVNSLDLWIAGLAEDHLPGSSVGQTFQKIMADQFQRLRDGDSNWYERAFSGKQLEAISATRLSDIIRRNTTITKIQDNVFFYSDSTLNGLIAENGYLPPNLIKSSGTNAKTPSLDGTRNNDQHITWGAAGYDLLRRSNAAYQDNVALPAGQSRPSPREISNKISMQTISIPNSRFLSSWIYGWGQFIDHDIGLTTTGTVPFNILVPKGDPSFDPYNTGTAVIPMSRSNYDASTGFSSPAVTNKVIKLIY